MPKSKKITDETKAQISQQLLDYKTALGNNFDSCIAKPTKEKSYLFAPGGGYYEKEKIGIIFYSVPEINLKPNKKDVTVDYFFSIMSKKSKSVTSEEDALQFKIKLEKLTRLLKQLQEADELAHANLRDRYEKPAQLAEGELSIIDNAALSLDKGFMQFHFQVTSFINHNMQRDLVSEEELDLLYESITTMKEAYQNPSDQAKIANIIQLENKIGKLIEAREIPKNRSRLWSDIGVYVGVVGMILSALVGAALLASGVGFPIGLVVLVLGFIASATLFATSIINIANKTPNPNLHLSRTTREIKSARQPAEKLKEKNILFRAASNANQSVSARNIEPISPRKKS